MSKRLLSTSIAALVLALAIGTSSASAAVGLTGFDVTFTDEDGSPALQAGSHPYAMRTVFGVNTKEGPGGGTVVDEPVKNLVVGQVPGFAGNPTAVPRCSTTDFLVKDSSTVSATECPNSSAVGLVTVKAGEKNGVETYLAPVYNLEPAPGKAAKLGFWAFVVPVTVDIGVSESPPYNVIATVTKISQTLEFFSSDLTLWGNPADPVHDKERGRCYEGLTSCSAGVPERAFLMSPRACEGPLATPWEVEAWTNPGTWVKDASTLTHDDATPPNPRGFSGCGLLGFSPSISAQPTSKATQSPTGLDFGVDINDEGINNPDAISDSDVKKAVVTLPEGVTINPSQAEGLEVCTEGQFSKEKSNSEFGAGCPAASKIGNVEVETPLLEDKVLKGSLFVAAPYTNRFGTLIALFMTIKSPELGINVSLAGKVEPDPKTGQLITTFDDLPQLPFSHFRLHFREGGRSPLVTPPRCGTFSAKAVFTPWANPSHPYTTSASFDVISGINGAPCPPGGVQPFHPGFEAGSINNNAGSYSPFYMRLIRGDGEQDMTKFSSVLPPGVLGKLKGLSKCPDAAVAIAKAKTGLQELASPSCPASSEIGHSLAGAGVGGALTYVGGKIYLSGPYKGDPLSVISITPAVAGPFDAGTVVLRLALTLNPKTAEVEVDGAASDPIPHILKGIPLSVRDIRVYVDKPDFTINPTSCDPSSTKATLFGGYLDVFSSADDVPVDLSSRYQAANCSSLGFKPGLAFNLKGGTTRGGHPGLLATYTPRPGDANLQGLVVRLPRSAFLDQGHIRTICTRVQFAADACPKGAQYGFIKAWTPLLDEPLEGPVYLRSSSHKLPDLVFDLHGLVDVEVATRIDSVKGGIRARVESAPDAPISKVLLRMQGQKKGLIVNSRDLCAASSKAKVQFSGQNGKTYAAKPVMRADCGGGRTGKGE